MNGARAIAALVICAAIAYGCYRLFLHVSRWQPDIHGSRTGSPKLIAFALRWTLSCTILPSTHFSGRRVETGAAAK